MSLYNVLRTGVSGMNAQSTKLASVSDNIANSNTVGYKRADTEFSSLVLDAPAGGYSSGAVTPNVRYEVSKQGALSYTLSKTDIAVEGNGFFVVQDPNTDASYLTRAGSFVLDGASGNLVNAGGYALLGYPSAEGESIAITLNDTAGLSPINLDYMNMRANPSTAGSYRVNLDAAESAIAGDSAGANTATSEFTFKNSIVGYDDLGTEVTLDIYWTKTQDYDPNTGAPPQWEVAVFDQSSANPAIATNFPYGTAGYETNPPIGGAFPANPVIASATLTFDPSTGAISELDGNPVTPSLPVELSIALPNATDPLILNLAGTSQLTAEFEPLQIDVNGNSPATVQDVEIDNEGRVYAIYEDGAEVEFYRLPLANVASPDQLSQVSGNVYAANNASGGLRIAMPDDGSNGSLVVGALEQSNVDLATELTDMIMAQRAYTANSKSFQAGNELLEVLVNLKR